MSLDNILITWIGIAILHRSRDCSWRVSCVYSHTYNTFHWLQEGMSHQSCIVHLSQLSGASGGCLRRVFRYILVWLTGYGASYGDYSLTYLCKHYVMYWTFIFSLLLLFAQCGYAFSLPLVFRIYVVDPATWVLRFRVVTVQIMSIPLVISTFAEMFWWPSSTGV